MSCPGREALESCAAGKASAQTAARVEAHARDCPGCARKLDWAGRENEAIRAWAAPGERDVEPLWADVRARIATPRRSRRWIPAAALGSAAALVLALFLARSGTKGEEAQTPSAASALASAEHDYARAVATLESQVAARHRASGRHAAALGRARSGLLAARASAGSEPGARVRVLEGYAAYLKSLRRALQDEP